MSEQYKPIPLPNEQRIEAANSFRTWHGVASAMNLIALAGLAVYFWRVIHPPDNLRFVGTPQFRG